MRGSDESKPSPAPESGGRDRGRSERGDARELALLALCHLESYVPSEWPRAIALFWANPPQAGSPAEGPPIAAWSATPAIRGFAERRVHRRGAGGHRDLLAHPARARGPVAHRVHRPRPAQRRVPGDPQPQGPRRPVRRLGDRQPQPHPREHPRRPAPRQAVPLAHRPRRPVRGDRGVRPPAHAPRQGGGEDIDIEPVLGRLRALTDVAAPEAASRQPRLGRRGDPQRAHRVRGAPPPREHPLRPQPVPRPRQVRHPRHRRRHRAAQGQDEGLRGGHHLPPQRRRLVRRRDRARHPARLEGQLHRDLRRPRRRRRQRPPPQPARAVAARAPEKPAAAPRPPRRSAAPSPASEPPSRVATTAAARPRARTRPPRSGRSSTPAMSTPTIPARRIRPADADDGPPTTAPPSRSPAPRPACAASARPCASSCAASTT
jgi:hypothetical protein